MPPSLHTVIWRALPQACMVLDEAGTILSVNMAAEEMLHLSRKKLEGTPWQAMVEDAKLWLLIRTASTQNQHAHLPHYLFKVKHGAPLTLHVHITPLMDAALPEAVLLTFEPATRTEQWAEEDVKQEINRSAAMLAAMLAHEVNNPLSGIRGAAQLLAEEVGEEQQSLATLICREVDRIRGVLDRVELFADASELPVQQVNIHEALRHARQVAEHGFARDIHFVEYYDPSLPEITTQRDALIHVLLNLLKNASEALAETEDPTITLHTRMMYGVHLKPAAGSTSHSAVAVEVCDNGAGIPESLRADIFKPYVSTNGGSGRGLGLAICQKLVQDMGGRLELLAEAPKHASTCFRILLNARHR